MCKSPALLFIVLLILTCLMVIRPSFESITKPSVPEFIVKFVDSSYNVPTTYSIDPYTGQNVTHPGYHVDNRTIELIITNQPFVSSNDSSGIPSFYYNVRMKGHYEENWTNLYSPDTDFPTQSNSSYTIISYGSGYNGFPQSSSEQFPSNSQLDFQVQALIGYVHRGYNPNATNQFNMFPWVFDGETSDWSNTQTVTLPETISASTSPTPTPTIPEFSGVVFTLITLAAASATISLVKSSNRSTKKDPNK